MNQISWFCRINSDSAMSSHRRCYNFRSKVSGPDESTDDCAEFPKPVLPQAPNAKSSPTNITPRLRNFAFVILPLVASNPSPILYAKLLDPTELSIENVLHRLNPSTVVPWCKSFSRQRCATKTLTPITVVLKLLTLQSTLRSNPHSAASARPPWQHNPFRLRKPTSPVVTAANTVLFIKWGRLYKAYHNKFYGCLN